MATSPTSSTPPPAANLSEAEVVVQMLGTDPWMRFDLWANRSWDAAEKAIEVAASAGTPMSSDDGLDPRVFSLIHAAALAKEFAEMVNPLMAVAGADTLGGVTTAGAPEMLISMVIDNDDLD